MPFNEIIDNELPLLNLRLNELKGMLRAKPPLKSVIRSERLKTTVKGDIIEAGDVFLSILSAISKAMGKLESSGVGINMSREPLEMKLEGYLVDVSKISNEIFLIIKNGKRSK